MFSHYFFLTLHASPLFLSSPKDKSSSSLPVSFFFDPQTHSIKFERRFTLIHYFNFSLLLWVHILDQVLSPQFSFCHLHTQ
ncbi:hypothetical protein S83_016444 [Arachis hypogaea]